MRVAVLILAGIGLCSGLCAAGIPDQLAGRKLLQDPEGMSVQSLATYLKYVDAKCGDPAKVTGNCLKLKNDLCGTRDTSEVLCTDGKDAVAQFRTASRYTRVGHLKCSLFKATCTTDPEGFGTGAGRTPATIDPRSLVAWNEYSMKCSNDNFKTSGATPAQCATLSGNHCSRPDVKCSAKGVIFYDTTNLKAKRAILKGDYDSGGLVFFVPQPASGAPASKTGMTTQG